MPTVNYNGKTVSDPNIQLVLSKVAVALNADVNVSSGDRSGALTVGAQNKSLHLHKRAADFHVATLSDEDAFKKLQEKKDDIFDSDKRYEVIRHGPFTETMGAHLHIGRFESGNGANFLQEGVTPDEKGKYTVARGHASVPSAALAMQQIQESRRKTDSRRYTG